MEYTFDLQRKDSEMKPILELQSSLSKRNERLAWLYCCDENQTKIYAQRYLHVLEQLENIYGIHSGAALFSASGRTEIGGNHTDHQHGCVLAGAVNIDMIAAVGENEQNKLRLTSEGYAPFVIDLTDLEKKYEEENTSFSILRGTCKAFANRGAKLKGLDIYVSSHVPKGSGVSSSAAFEVLMGTILNELCMEERISAVEIAKIGQWVENVYFGKPCGLMDQMASSVGGVVEIDFADPENPVVTAIDMDLSSAGYKLCILDSGADHADLTDEYAAVPAECKQVATLCGGEVLREVPYETFLKNIPYLRGKCSDRAILRAIHFYHDNERAKQEAKALKSKDYDTFLRLLTESGDSSWEYLQNITLSGAINQQSVGLTIAFAKELLHGKGAVRVHGGGFAGTVQAFVPIDMVNDFQTGMEAVLGKGSCHILSIRPVGGYRLA